MKKYKKFSIMLDDTAIKRLETMRQHIFESSDISSTMRFAIYEAFMSIMERKKKLTKQHTHNEENNHI